MSITQADEVRAVLDQVQNPRTGKGLVASGMIHDLTVDAATKEASFTFMLRRDDPATLVRHARQALGNAGYPQPKIKVTDPAGPAPTTHQPPQSAAAGVPRR